MMTEASTELDPFVVEIVYRDIVPGGVFIPERGASYLIYVRNSKIFNSFEYEAETLERLDDPAGEICDLVDILWKDLIQKIEWGRFQI